MEVLQHECYFTTLDKEREDLASAACALHADRERLEHKVRLETARADSLVKECETLRQNNTALGAPPALDEQHDCYFAALDREREDLTAAADALYADRERLEQKVRMEADRANAFAMEVELLRQKVALLSASPAMDEQHECYYAALDREREDLAAAADALYADRERLEQKVRMESARADALAQECAELKSQVAARRVRFTDEVPQHELYHFAALGKERAEELVAATDAMHANREKLELLVEEAKANALASGALCPCGASAQMNDPAALRDNLLEQVEDLSKTCAELKQQLQEQQLQQQQQTQQMHQEQQHIQQLQLRLQRADVQTRERERRLREETDRADQEYDRSFALATEREKLRASLDAITTERDDLMAAACQAGIEPMSARHSKKRPSLQRSTQELQSHGSQWPQPGVPDVHPLDRFTVWRGYR